MKIYGYVRVSTLEQNTDRQVFALKKVGVKEENIFIDKASGKDFDRPAYRKLIETIEAGDLLYIKSLDRLGRNYHEMLSEWHSLVNEKQIDIAIIDLPILDTRKRNGLTAELIYGIILQLSSFIAQTERETILARQKEGIKAAKLRGVKFGRPELERTAEFYKLKQFYLNDEISSRQAAQRLDISHTTFLRWVKE